MSAHFAALFEPWPVMGSFRTVASAIPRTCLPDGRAATGFRTTGGSEPGGISFLSGSAIFVQRSASQGKYVSRIHFDLARCCCGVFTSLQQSIGPTGIPSKTMISHGPVVVSAGNTKYSPTPGMRLKQTVAYG